MDVQLSLLSWQMQRSQEKSLHIITNLIVQPRSSTRRKIGVPQDGVSTKEQVWCRIGSESDPTDEHSATPSAVQIQWAAASVTANRCPTQQQTQQQIQQPLAPDQAASAQQSDPQMARRSQQPAPSAGSPQFYRNLRNPTKPTSISAPHNPRSRAPAVIPCLIEGDMPVRAAPEFSFFSYHGTYARCPQTPHLSVQDIKMDWLRLEDQGARKGGGIEPSRCVERVIEVQELALAMVYHPSVFKRILPQYQARYFS